MIRWNAKRLGAVLGQRCPVCLEGGMFGGPFRMLERCRICGHRFERETGFFQGAMYVSWVLGVGTFTVFALFATWLVAPRFGIWPAMAVAVALYLPTVPVLFRYSRVVWAHVNIGTLEKIDRES